jgi:Rieske Fe-S protein
MSGFLFLRSEPCVAFWLLHNKWSCRCVLRSKTSMRHARKLTLKHVRFKLCNSLRKRSTIYAKIHTHLRYFGSHFTQKSARAITRARFLRRNFWATFVVMKQIYDYAKICTHLRCFGSYFTQKFFRARTHARSDARDFYVVIYGSHSSLRNRSMIYAKIHTHLRCFGSRFTQKNRPIQNPRSIGSARFLRRNVWSHSSL